MNDSDDVDGFPTKSIPDLIKHLWDLYVDMSKDPALEATAEYIKQAVLTLEHTRRLAFEVYQEQPARRSSAAVAVLPDEDMDTEAGNWIRIPKAGSHSKH